MRYLLILLLIFSPIVNSLSNQDVAAGYSQYISGLWAEAYDDSGNIFFYSHYFSNGQVHSYGYTDPNDDKSYYVGDGTWEIINGNRCITITYSSDKNYEPGYSWCNRIVEINTKVFIFKSPNGNTTMHRISDGKLQ